MTINMRLNRFPEVSEHGSQRPPGQRLRKEMSGLPPPAPNSAIPVKANATLRYNVFAAQPLIPVNGCSLAKPYEYALRKRREVFMKAREIMTRRVVSVRPEDSILQAGELMLQHDISGLPVVDSDRRVLGVVTERDFMRCAGACGDFRPRWLEVLIGRAQLGDGAAQRCESRIAEVMTHNPVTATEDMLIEDVVRLMDTHRIKRVPVVRDGRLVGIIARVDLMRALIRSIRAGHNAAKSHEALRSHMAELERQTWLQRSRS